MKYVPPLGEAPDTPYIDGNPAAGIEGSIVPAASIEHDQREIVAVIEGAGLTPDSADLTQLTQAIAKFITDAIAAIPAVPNATTTKRGIVELATNTEASAGTDTVRAVTPAGLAAAIAALAIDLNDFVKKTGDTMTGPLTILKGFPSAIFEDSNSDLDFNRARIGQNNNLFIIQTQKDDGSFVSNDYLMAKDVNGAISHQWATNGAARMFLNGSGLLGLGTTNPLQDLHVVRPSAVVRLSDSSATTDAEVVAHVEFYKGPNDSRVGLIGFPNALNEYLTIRNDAVNGRIRFIVGGTERTFIENDGSVVVLSGPPGPAGGAMGAGTLNAEALFVDGQPVLTDAGNDFGTNGYLLLNNGFMIQWGEVTHPGTTPVTVKFPMKFPTDVLSITATTITDTFVKNGLRAVSWRNAGPVEVEFMFWFPGSDPRPSPDGGTARWIAIGH
jgi:hypothetical protein